MCLLAVLLLQCRSSLCLHLENGLAWIERFNIKNCLITLKDHKREFHSNPSCRLIILTKSQIGKIIKVILKKNFSTLRIAININQYHNTNDCIKWFKNFSWNDKSSFINYSFKEFYPFITEKKTVDKALNLAQEFMLISEDKIKIIIVENRYCTIMRFCVLKKELLVISVNL